MYYVQAILLSSFITRAKYLRVEGKVINRYAQPSRS
jgi:hypothetical protein